MATISQFFLGNQSTSQAEGVQHSDVATDWEPKWCIMSHDSCGKLPSNIGPHGST